MITLAEIIAFTEQLSLNVRDGHGDALDALAQLRAMQGAVMDALKEVDEAALTQAQSYHEKTFVHHGLTFTRSEGKRAFRYDHLKPWAEAKKTLAAIEERAKNAALQGERKLIVAGEGDGVVEEPAIITYGRPSISIVRA